MKMRAKYLILGVALLCLLVAPGTAFAADDGDKVDASVTTVLEAAGESPVPVIVYTQTGEEGVVDRVTPDGVETTVLDGFDAVAAYLTGSEIRALARYGCVDLIVADNPVFGFDYVSSLDITNLAIGLDRVAAPAAGGPTGAGVGVAVLDSGVTTTSDLGAGRIVGWKDFVNRRTTPYDDAGHGTFVTGLIAGDGTASLPLDAGGYAEVQFRGVAPAADVVGIKVLDETGQGRASAVMAGVLWAIAHKDRYNIRVLNLSIGSNPVAPADFDPMTRVVEYAWLNGITVVCAAGNEGEFGAGGILSPGTSPYVITVGATDTRQTRTTSDDVVTYYSSVGPTLWDEYAKPDLVAPGNRLVSMRVRGSYIDVGFPQNLISVDDYAPDDPDKDPDYLMLSGTSTSAPVCAGVAALMIGEDDTLSPDDVKVRMMTTADPLDGVSRFKQGAGRLDAAAALASTLRSPGSALSEDVGDGTTILSDEDYAAWEQATWAKYGWTRYRWNKPHWNKFRWTRSYGAKSRWGSVLANKFRWTKFRWTKFRWTSVAWSKFRWTKFRWTKFRWTEYEWAKFRWTEYEWAKFRWTILLEGQ
ncbi:MAG TPA: S8 family peptidase [Thermoleophilia bacterium]|nr:S8 family peptidase [Actinomycetota bacterium]HQF51501.1 S8 family peptidase [Thermoleophilia bacterium]HQH20888.1 S8 family peptidase [Thermoleophilia bacterium]